MLALQYFELKTVIFAYFSVFGKRLAAKFKHFKQQVMPGSTKA